MFKPFAIIALLLAQYVSAQAQQSYFIYIQSEDKQPFYVILNGKQYNSTITGYSTIPKLTQGQYNIEINAIKNHMITRVSFVCSMHEQDVGFLLKNVEGKGFILIDLQTQKTIEPIQAINSVKTAYTSNFGEMLTDVTDDSALKNKNNTLAGMVKISENSIDETSLYTYVDVQKSGKVDTIKISIPKNKIDTNMIGIKTIIKKDMLPIKDTNNIAVALLKDSVINTSTAVAPNNTLTTQATKINPVNNPICHALAGAEEVEKLKRSFVQEALEEDMIALAKRQFEKKCFTTVQIKSLGRLFLSDANRFQFFKAAYPFIYDMDQASSLQYQLVDAYYVSLFQSLFKE